MSEPIRIQVTRDELLAAARQYMISTYGEPKELYQDAKDHWHERYGMLVSFVMEVCP